MFPWSSKISDLLVEPNWNRHQPFEPVDGVKYSNKEIENADNPDALPF